MYCLLLPDKPTIINQLVYISINFVDRVFDAPALYSGVENLFAVYGYALQIYCDFSGYSDIAIGVAVICKVVRVVGVGGDVAHTGPQ